MPSPVEETFPPGMQSLSDAVARAVNVSERSVVTSVEQETTSEHELVLKANTAEESVKKPLTGVSSTEPVDTSDDTKNGNIVCWYEGDNGDGESQRKRESC